MGTLELVMFKRMRAHRHEKAQQKLNLKLQTDVQVLKKQYLLADEQDDSRIKEKGIGDKQSFKILLSFAAPFKFQILFALFIIFLSSGFAIYSAKLMGVLVEKGLLIKDTKASLLYAGFIILCEGLSIFLIWRGRLLLSRQASNVVLLIRERLFHKLQLLPLTYYDRQPQGRVVTRISHDVEGIEEFFTSSLGNLLSATIMTFLALAAMIMSDFRLGTIMFLATLPSLFLMYKSKDFLRNSNRRVSKFSSAINAKLSEFLNGIDVIRAYGLEKWSMREYNQSVDQYLYAQLKGNVLFAWSMPTISFFATVPLIGLVWFGGLDILAGTLSLGLFVSFVRFYDRFSNPIMLLSREIHVVQQAFTSTERVMSFLSEPDENSTLGNNGTLVLDGKENRLSGDIKFENVWMSYQNEDWILKNLSFHIKNGEKIGLVGKTGCGKSSTVSLITRLYDFQQGQILLDDIPLRLYDRNSLRDQIGFVAQDAVIFKGTLRENLAGGGVLSDFEIIEACKTTGLLMALGHDYFDLNKEILEGGVNLSVGERQLLALTRVLLKNPSILVLDEATANIDPHYELIIQNAVYKMMDQRTCLMIAHRLDTLKDCDRIFVFHEGQLVEHGSLDELMSKKEFFYKLHHAQDFQH